MPVRLAIAAGVLCCTIGADCRAQHNSLAAPVARLPTLNLQVTPADLEQAGSERWIVWDAWSGHGHAAHVALCDATGRCRWERVWPDGYEPIITTMNVWSDTRTPLFLVTCQMGAKAETAVVIG